MERHLLVRKTLPYIAAAVGSWYFYKLLIKPFLSPLRKMPGRPYKPIIGNMFEALKEEAMTNTIRWMKECNSRIIRFYFLYGEERVLVADPEIVKYIMVTNSKNYVHASSAINNILPEFLLVLDGDEHHALKKLLNPAFRSIVVNDFIPLFEETAQKVMFAWKKEIDDTNKSDMTVEAQSYMCRLTLDVICRCGFDFDMNAVDNPKNPSVLSFRRILEGLQLSISNMLPFEQYFPTKKNKQAWADSKFFKNTIATMLKEKKKKMEEGKDSSVDLLSRLLMARDDQGNSLSDECVNANVGGFLFAGFETTSMNLTWTLLKLAELPHIQEKVRQEVISLVGDDKPITSQTVENLTYLTCVIKESLRLLPPVPSISRRSINKDTLGGYTVPAGTPVMISVGALHRFVSNYCKTMYIILILNNMIVFLLSNCTTAHCTSLYLLISFRDSYIKKFIFYIFNDSFISRDVS